MIKRFIRWLLLTTSIIWVIVYVGGGSFAFAWAASTHIHYVAPYMPLLIFLWVAGFFVGHCIIEKIVRKILK
jgi:hypothetical protein